MGIFNITIDINDIINLYNSDFNSDRLIIIDYIMSNKYKMVMY